METRLASTESAMVELSAMSAARKAAPAAGNQAGALRPGQAAGDGAAAAGA